MGLNVVSSNGVKHTVVQSIGMKAKVVKNKNTGQSFWVMGRNDSLLELSPIQGREVHVKVEDFTAESWEVIH
jgi:hypothetical protein